MLGLIESGVYGAVGAAGFAVAAGAVAAIGSSLLVAGAVVGVSIWMWRAN